MRWFRYYDLVRYVKINPAIKEHNLTNVIKNIEVDVADLIFVETHYFKQPGLKGIQLADGSKGVSQENVGGLRIVDIVDPKMLEEQAWNLGYHWIDFITSWNNLVTKDLEKNDWVLDYKSVVPWRLNPIEKDYFCDITFLSEKPLDNNFVVHRSYSDHGRVGSL